MQTPNFPAQALIGIAALLTKLLQQCTECNAHCTMAIYQDSIGNAPGPAQLPPCMAAVSNCCRHSKALHGLLRAAAESHAEAESCQTAAATAELSRCHGGAAAESCA